MLKEASQKSSVRFQSVIHDVDDAMHPLHTYFQDDKLHSSQEEMVRKKTLRKMKYKVRQR